MVLLLLLMMIFFFLVGGDVDFVVVTAVQGVRGKAYTDRILFDI